MNQKDKAKALDALHSADLNDPLVCHGCKFERTISQGDYLHFWCKKFNEKRGGLGPNYNSKPLPREPDCKELRR